MLVQFWVCGRPQYRSHASPVKLSPIIICFWYQLPILHLRCSITLFTMMEQCSPTCAEASMQANGSCIHFPGRLMSGSPLTYHGVCCCHQTISQLGMPSPTHHLPILPTSPALCPPHVLFHPLHSLTCSGGLFTYLLTHMKLLWPPQQQLGTAYQWRPVHDSCSLHHCDAW